MASTPSTKRILEKVNCPFLTLYKGVGYWYFVYDDPKLNVFETKSVYTPYLGDLTLDMWVADGKELKEIGDQLRREAGKALLESQ